MRRLLFLMRFDFGRSRKSSLPVLNFSILLQALRDGNGSVFSVFLISPRLFVLSCQSLLSLVYKSSKFLVFALASLDLKKYEQVRVLYSSKIHFLYSLVYAELRHELAPVFTFTEEKLVWIENWQTKEVKMTLMMQMRTTFLLRCHLTHRTQY